MTTYYLDGSATGANNGGPGNDAWQTIDLVALGVSAGDTVIMRQGTYSVGNVGWGWNLTKPGTEFAPIKFVAYPGEVVIVNAATTVSPGDWTNYSGAIYYISTTAYIQGVFDDNYPLFGSSPPTHSIPDLGSIFANSYYLDTDANRLYVWLEDSTNPADSVMKTAIGHTCSFDGAVNWNVFDGIVFEYGLDLVKWQIVDESRANNIVFKNCTFRYSSSTCINSWNKLVVKNCLFQKIGASKLDHAVYTRSSGLVVSDNVFEELSGAAFHSYEGPDDTSGGYNVIRNNIFRIPRKCWGIGLEYYYDIVIWGEGYNFVYNNVFYGEDKRLGVDLHSANNKIMNNSFVGIKNVLKFYTGINNNVIKNNIFRRFSNGSYIDWNVDSPQIIDYNIYWGAALWRYNGDYEADFAAYIAANGESHSLNVDPEYTASDNAVLLDSSPAINMGFSQQLALSDIDNYPRSISDRYKSGRCAVGAYENVAGQVYRLASVKDSKYSINRSTRFSR